MTNFAIANVAPWKLNSMVRAIMRQAEIDDPTRAVELVMSGDLKVTRNRLEWKVIDGGIMELPPYRTDGTPLAQLARQLKEAGYVLSDFDMPPFLDRWSDIGTKRKVVVLPGEWIRQNIGTTEKELRNYAGQRGWLAPFTEDAFYLREILTDGILEQMNLHGVMTMHEPYIMESEVGEDVEETEWLLTSDRYNGSRQFFPKPSKVGRGLRRISRSLGYAFIVP